MQKDIVHNSTTYRELHLHGKEAKKGLIFYTDTAELKLLNFIPLVNLQNNCVQWNNYTDFHINNREDWHNSQT